MRKKDVLDEYQEKLSSEMSQGGGCEEAWAAAQAARESNGHGRRSFLRGSVLSAIGAIPALGSVGSVAANNPDEPIDELSARARNAHSEYSTPGAIIDAISSHGMDTIDAAHRNPEVDIRLDKLLDSEFIRDNMVNASEIADRAESVVVLGTVDEQAVHTQ